MPPAQRPGFEVKDQLVSVLRLGVHVLAAAAVLAFGEGLLWVVHWTGGDSYAERFLDVLSRVAIWTIAAASIISGATVFISDTWADLKLRLTYNRELVRKVHGDDDTTR